MISSNAKNTPLHALQERWFSQNCQTSTFYQSLSVNIAAITTVITIQVLACRSNNCNLRYCYAASLLSLLPLFLFIKEQCCAVAFHPSSDVGIVKPVLTRWKHFLILLPFSFLIFLLHVPFKLFCFPCRLLVGAPREKAFPAQQANRTGGLYSCDIASPNTNCMRVKFDEESKFFSAFILNWNSCLILLVWCPFLRHQFLLGIYT